MTKIKITSDGTGIGTVIHINGERLENASEMTWHVKASGLAEVRIKLFDVELDIDGQAALKFEGTPDEPRRIVHCTSCPPGGYCDECHRWMSEQVRLG